MGLSVRVPLRQSSKVTPLHWLTTSSSLEYKNQENHLSQDNHPGEDPFCRKNPPKSMTGIIRVGARARAICKLEVMQDMK